MKAILMLVNWKVTYTVNKVIHKQPPDYYISGEPYWFFRYWPEPVHVDVIDIGQGLIPILEKKVLKLYIIQTIRALFILRKYDLILSHGAQSGIFLCLLRKIFKLKSPKHILIDVGAFQSGSEHGIALKLIKYASSSLNGVIYHTKKQIEYYQRVFPWLVDRSIFIKYGADKDYFNRSDKPADRRYIACIGYQKRDWATLIQAFKGIDDPSLVLKLIGKTGLSIDDPRVEQIPYIPLPNLVREMELASFLVLPLKSFNYSFGQMTLLQGMCLGKATIVARVPSTVDYIEDMKTGVFYIPGDAEDLKEKINLLLNDADLRLRIGRQARMAIENDLNEERMSKEISAFCRKIVDQ